jgi:hypothetical protein
MTAQVLEREQMLVGNEPLTVHVGNGGGGGERFLEIEVADAALDGGKFHATEALRQAKSASYSRLQRVLRRHRRRADPARHATMRILNGHLSKTRLR